MCQYTIDPCIVQKLDTLFATYTCFNECVQVIASKSRGRPLATVRPVLIKTKELDVGQRLQRETLSLMNKLSPANKNVIWDKLMKYIDNNNSQHVVPDILDSVVSNAMYISLIVEFLTRLHERGIEVDSYVSNYVTDTIRFICDDTLFSTIVPKEVEEYDEFCCVQKQKRHLTSKLQFCNALPVNLTDSAKKVRELRQVAETALANTTYSNSHIDVLFELCMSTRLLPMNRIRDVYIVNGLDNKISNRLKILTKLQMS